MIPSTEQCRFALNCDNVKPSAAPTETPCPYCRSPWSLHATKGNTITDVGFIRGDHPAWVAMLELIKPKE